LSIFRNVAEVV